MSSALVLSNGTDEARAVSAAEGQRWWTAKSRPVLPRPCAGAKQGLKTSTVTEMSLPSQAPRWPCVLACCGGASLRGGPGAAPGRAPSLRGCCRCGEPETGDLSSADAATLGGEKEQA